VNPAEVLVHRVTVTECGPKDSPWEVVQRIAVSLTLVTVQAVASMATATLVWLEPKFWP
jgi:hypothetical protein